MRPVMLALLLGALLPPGNSQAAETAQEPANKSQYQASLLMDMQVKNTKEENLGTIADLLIDARGKISSVVLREVGLLGMGEHRYVVPWSRLKVAPDQKLIVIDVAKDRLATEFSAFEPPERGEAGGGGR